MTSMLVFVIAFAVGCLSGVLIALWSGRWRTGRPDHASSLWPLRDGEPTTIQRMLRRLGRYTGSDFPRDAAASYYSVIVPLPSRAAARNP